MNRIELYFIIDPYKGNSIRVSNDLRGLTCYCRKIENGPNGEFDRSADNLFMLLTNVDYKKIPNYMNYGIRVQVVGCLNDEIFKDEYYKKLLNYCVERGYEVTFTNARRRKV